jgi:hypothetical protein
MEQLRQALKEWLIAINALEQGQTILLLRKGGIRETGGRFSVPCDRVLLYPTFEHQHPDLLKSDYSSRVQMVESGWHPEAIKIGSFADITDVFQVTEPEIVTSLLPFHIWNGRFVEERLKWKPRSPLYLLLLRVWKLPSAREIKHRESYGGCKSWIELESSPSNDDAIDIQNATPVLSEGEYRDRSNQIREIVMNEMPTLK